MYIKLLIISFLSLFSSSKNVNVFFDVKEDVIFIENLHCISANACGISVYYGEVSKTTNQPKIIGEFTNSGFAIRFRSKYGFSTGTSYTVLITSKNQVERFVVHTPKSNYKPSTYIKNVYPTASQLPMNQLKFYIEFSAPMRQGNAFQNIHLYKLPEEKLESEAFLVTAEELWNPEKTRVTIFFDPGRIKRGVQPNLQLGLPLVEGHKYKLVIDKEWLDVNDVKLTKGFEKIFDVVSVDRESPSSENWKTDFPKAKNKLPIKIDFKEAMDFGLLHSAIVIVDQENRYVEGIIKLSENESKWMFTPKNKWLKGNYKMIINAWLEDLSGNNLNRKFDVNLNSERDAPKNIKEVQIPFKIN
jgi:hypothetical protein